MEDNENVATVKTIEHALQKGDLHTVFNYLDDEIVWIVAGSHSYPFAGVYKGKKALLKIFSMVGNVTKTDEFELIGFICQDNKVVVLGHELGAAWPNNRRFDNHWAHLFILEAGKVIEFREYYTYTRFG